LAKVLGLLFFSYLISFSNIVVLTNAISDGFHNLATKFSSTENEFFFTFKTIKIYKNSLKQCFSSKFTTSSLLKVPSNFFNSSFKSAQISINFTKLEGPNLQFILGSIDQFLLIKIYLFKLFYYKRHFNKLVSILTRGKKNHFNPTIP